MKKQNKKGFTLVELLVVIAILAILGTVSIVGYTSFTKKANESVCLQEATQLRDVILAEDINNDNFSIGDDGKIDFASGSKSEKYFKLSKSSDSTAVENKTYYSLAADKTAVTTVITTIPSDYTEGATFAKDEVYEKVYENYGIEDLKDACVDGLSGTIEYTAEDNLTYTYKNYIATINFSTGITTQAA